MLREGRLGEVCPIRRTGPQYNGLRTSVPRSPVVPLFKTWCARRPDAFAHAGAQNRLLVKSSQFHAQPIAKSGHFEAIWGEGRSRRHPERILTQNTKYDYKGRFPKSGVRAISGFAELLEVQKTCSF